jgi:hypothetical protein
MTAANLGQWIEDVLGVTVCLTAEATDAADAAVYSTDGLKVRIAGPRIFVVERVRDDENGKGPYVRNIDHCHSVAALAACLSGVKSIDELAADVLAVRERYHKLRSRAVLDDGEGFYYDPTREEQEIDTIARRHGFGREELNRAADAREFEEELYRNTLIERAGDY